MVYDAFDPDLHLWVAACLYRGIEDIYRRSHDPLADDDAEAYYRSAAVLGTTLQVHPEQWPADRAAFGRYWAEGVARIRIDEVVRHHLDDVAMLRFLPAPLPALLGPGHRWVTTGFLPSAFRHHMRYRWTRRDQRIFDVSMAVVFAVDRRLPGVVPVSVQHHAGRRSTPGPDRSTAGVSDLRLVGSDRLGR